MLRFCLFLLIPLAAHAGDECRSAPEASLRVLKNREAEPDTRAEHGACLFRFHSDKAEVAQTLLRVMRDESEDVLLREDLVTAFAEAPLRKRVKVEGKIGPELGKIEKTAVERTVASAGDILALTQAVKSMDEIVPASRYEGEFVKALAEIALDERNHILLRSVAVESLERVTRVAVDSGVYDARALRTAHDTLKTLAYLDDDGYYNGARTAYQRLEKDEVVMAAVSRTPTRAISSQQQR